jgi:flagellar hook assembly protein FlgD
MAALIQLISLPPESSVRTTAVSLALMLAALLGMYAPAAASTYVSDAKVVIVLGAVGSQTSSFKTSADAAYAEAIKYTPNVTKVYSPNATWAKVKAALAGANVVIYLGHGNGFPSKYSTTARPTTQNGMGLNDPANLSDSKHINYGESYIDDVTLAPNAIVLLNRLCYASGNAEPGDPQPTATVARTRVDNYAAGFIRAGARAVIADGHRGLAPYIKALFTTNQTIEQVWRTNNQYGNITTFASSRSTGFTGFTDPKTPTTDWYRSMVAKPTLTTKEITGAVGDTGADPAEFAVPGRAAVGADGATLSETPDGEPVASLAAGTRLVLVDRLSVLDEGAEQPTEFLSVEGLDDPSIRGLVRAAELLPRDSTPPTIFALDSTAAFSPNGDGKHDTASLGARFSETVTWRIRVQGADGSTIAEATGTGKDAAMTWNGLVGGVAVPDGSYTYTVRGEDAWGNTPASTSGKVKVDTAPPVITDVSPATDVVPWFSPNGDTTRETVAMTGVLSEAGKLVVRVRSGDVTVRGFTVDAKAGAFSVAWNGKDDSGAIVPDGTYEFRVIPKDALENVGTGVSRSVTVNTLIGHVATSHALFYPQDKDSRAPRTTLSFAVGRASTVTWTLRNAAGQVVETFLAGEALEAGPVSRVFDGRRLDGTMLPAGKYTSFVSATDGTMTATQSVKLEMNAFSITSSVASPTRGKKVTITAVSSESLSMTPRLYISQPGKSTWSVVMKKIGTRTYRVTVTMKTGGSKGTVTFKVLAKDSGGNKQSTKLALPLR